MEPQNSDKTFKIIIEQCIQGRRDAWERFIKQFSGLVMWSARTRLEKNGCYFTNNDIEDIHQEVFLSLYNENKLARLTNASSIAMWLSVLSGNIALNYIRRQRGRRIDRETLSLFEEISPSEELGQTIADTLRSDNPSAPDVIDKTLQKQAVYEAIRTLSPKERLILNLFFVRENNIKEIAQCLSLPQGSVASGIARAKDKIKQIIKEKGLL